MEFLTASLGPSMPTALGLTIWSPTMFLAFSSIPTALRLTVWSSAAGVDNTVVLVGAVLLAPLVPPIPTALRLTIWAPTVVVTLFIL
jgi:hypothetical protein